MFERLGDAAQKVLLRRADENDSALKNLRRIRSLCRGLSNVVPACVYRPFLLGMRLVRARARQLSGP